MMPTLQQAEWIDYIDYSTFTERHQLPYKDVRRIAKFILGNIDKESDKDDTNVFIETCFFGPRVTTFLYADDDVVVGCNCQLKDEYIFVPRWYSVSLSFVKALSTIRERVYFEFSPHGVTAVAGDREMKAESIHFEFPDLRSILNAFADNGYAYFNTKELLGALERIEGDDAVTLRWKDVFITDDESRVMVKGAHQSMSQGHRSFLTAVTDMYSTYHSLVLEVPLVPLLKLVRSYKAAGVEEIALVFSNAPYLKVEDTIGLFSDYWGIIRLNKPPVYGRSGR